MNERISYLNGEFLNHKDCFVHIEDRGFQFADGVYEVVLFHNGKLIDSDAHIERLFSSLNEIKIDHDFSKEQIENIMIDLFAKNHLTQGSCYIQISRGTHNRVQNCPKGIKPTICATINPKKQISEEEFQKGFTVITHDDIRWHRCDIKSVSLIAPTLTNQKAKDLGFNDAIFIRDGIVTEATFANVFIVDEKNKLITKNADNLILQGITRNRIIKLAKNAGIEVEERSFTKEELLNAKEIFLTSSTLIVRPVVKVDNAKISAKVGPISSKLRDLYINFIENKT